MFKSNYDGLLKEQVSWVAPVLPRPVVPAWLWPWFCPAPSVLWAHGIPVFQPQSLLTASLPSLQYIWFWHCASPASHSFHCSVHSGAALALLILGVVKQIVLLPLGELRHHLCLVLFTATLLHPLLPELLFSWPWPCLVGLDYPCMCCRTSSMGWVVATGRSNTQVLEFF